MSKIEIRFEADAAMVAEIQDGGLDPVEAARAGLLAAVDALRSPGANGRSRPWPKPNGPATAERLAREWAETNRDALEEHRRLIAERGSFADSARRW